MTASLKHSPLHEVHSRLGASFIEFAGWQMPLRYSGELAEHRAVRTRAGLFDLSHMAEFRVGGPRAGEALDYALVGWLSRLRPGQARYTMACDDAGGVLDDLVVYRRQVEDFLIVANAANTEVVGALLEDRCGGFSAVVEDLSAGYGLLALQGPSAAAVIRPHVPEAVTALTNYTFAEAEAFGETCLVARTGYTGEDGFELLVPAGRAARLFEAVLDAGAGDGVLPVGLAARDSLRLEAGMPLYGHELSRELTPFEAGLGRVVRFEKGGDFVGRGALEDRQAAGPTHQLVGLLSDGRRAPRHGYPVLRTVEPDAGAIGWVTSGAPSPTLGRPIAMAYVEAAAAEPGRSVAVEVRGRLEPAAVCDLPFYRGSRPPTKAAASSAPKEHA